MVHSLGKTFKLLEPSAGLEERSCGEMMMKEELKFENICSALLARIPELKVNIEYEFGHEYDLASESPGAYPIFEDVVQYVLFENLETGDNPGLLTRLFDLFEDMSSSRDKDVADLVRIAILEGLVYRTRDYELSMGYMGPRTAQYASWEKDRQEGHVLPNDPCDPVDHATKQSLGGWPRSVAPLSRVPHVRTSVRGRMKALLCHPISKPYQQKGIIIS